VFAWELGNEVNGYRFVLGTGAVTAQTYADDYARLAALVARVTPQAKVVGPASAFWPVIGEVAPVLPEVVTRLGAQLETVSWHYYPQESRRCPAHVRLAGPEVMQHADALDDMGHWARQVGEVLARASPNAESWVSETGNAQCGGEPGVSDRAAGTWWWLDTLGQMAANGQSLVIRQTLSGSNYGLLDDLTLEPRPDYWATVLWKRLMGPTVLRARSTAAGVRAWAHCGRAGGVAVLVLNLEKATSTVTLPASTGRAFVLGAEALDSATLTLDGEPLALAADGSLPAMPGVPWQGPHLELPAHSAAFVAFDAAPSVCAP
jgi:heparanase 1